jgi:hypothetical protein
MKNRRRSTDSENPVPVYGSTSQDIGEPPGSPAYFGGAGAAGGGAEVAPDEVAAISLDRVFGEQGVADPGTRAQAVVGA